MSLGARVGGSQRTKQYGRVHTLIVSIPALIDTGRPAGRAAFHSSRLRHTFHSIFFAKKGTVGLRKE